jgi:DNA (cytosine-5)-methyltransferase 3A
MALKYLSLFSGIGGFELGILNSFPDAECIGFSEIDKYAIQTYRKHFPEHELLGNIVNINPYALPDFDLMVGGFPCQDLSIAKAGRKGLSGERSGLFWTMLSIMRIKNPKYFCFENVASMPRQDRDMITKELGVEPVMINAALVSAQSRKRLFWTNIPNITLPEHTNIYLIDILESGYPLNLRDNPLKSYCIDANYWKSENLKHHLKHHLRQLVLQPIRVGDIGSKAQGQRVYSVSGESVSLSANGGGQGAKTGLYFIGCPDGDYVIRKLTPVECERLQCFEDGWTEGVSNTQRYRQLGNAVNVEVVKHIFSALSSTDRIKSRWR